MKQPIRARIRDNLTRAAAVALFCATPTLCWAARTGPFGAGLPDDSGFSGVAFFPRAFGWLISTQIYFNQQLTLAVKALRSDATHVWPLLGISFAYGILHAVGPGHGKAVVSSYVLATRQALRNAIVLAFLASLAQAGAAIALILVATALLHLTSASLTWATYQFEIASNALIFLLGCWLVWLKLIKPARIARRPYEPTRLFAEPAALLSPGTRAPMRFEAAGVSAAPARSGRAFAATDATEPVDCDCGVLHIPDGRHAAEPLNWRKAWTVVAATALRPCTGALIVLVFAISQNLLWAGVASTLVMGLGTAITVAGLAVLAVGARQAAFVVVRLDSPLGRALKRGVEGASAMLILCFGLAMLIASVMA